MTITGWQLALIILGTLWLGALAGFFVCACLTVASDADDAEYRYWLATHPDLQPSPPPRLCVEKEPGDPK